MGRAGAPAARQRPPRWPVGRPPHRGQRHLWKLATGVPWRDLPERYGPWQTGYERFRRWQADGTWDRLVACAQAKSDAVGEIDWDISIDATVVRAHQHAAGARK